MCTPLSFRDEKLGTLKKKISDLRNEMEPFVSSEEFDAKECLRLSRILDSCVADYMNLERAV